MCVLFPPPPTGSVAFSRCSIDKAHMMSLVYSLYQREVLLSINNPRLCVRVKLGTTRRDVVSSFFSSDDKKQRASIFWLAFQRFASVCLLCAALMSTIT